MNRHDFYISNNGVKFGITVKSWSMVKIKCEDNNWNDFTFMRIPKSNEVDLVKNFRTLRFLDLSENSLVLSKDTFNETWNLDKLYLHGNGLTELPLYIFHKLLHLRVLMLQRNSLNLPSELFQNNKKLKRLLFTNNKALLPTLTGDLLTDLENLEIIHLKRNGFTSLPENLFWGSTSLKYIDLNENYLEELPELIFFDLVEIEYLLLSRNQIKILPDEVFKYLKYLEVLDLSYNRIVYVQRILLEGLTSLRELYMEGNRLINIHNEAFLTNEQLSIAKFSYNQLQFSYFNNKMSPFLNNHLLKELHLANNRINKFFFDWTINKVELEFLDLSYNNISVISANDFVFTSNKFVVDLRHNNINNILLTNIENLAIYNTEKRHVIVQVENNSLSCDCSLYDVVRYFNGDMPVTVYNFFELRLGNLTCVKPNGIQGPQINQLDFKTYQCPEDDYFQIEKNCQTMCSCNIRPYDKMRVLDCSYNKISLFFIDKNKMNMKGNYPLTLNLTGNNLRFIPPLNDLESFNLTHLLLSNNKISHLAVYRLPKSIEVLELHNNHLSSMNHGVSEFLLNQNYKELTLSGNPFICDCASKYLHELVSKKQKYYKDLKNVKCKDHNIPLVKMTVKQLCLSDVPLEKIIKIME
ncbi:PREDICTED: protein toll-like [Polistes dominula]|uniref:Protein toll-like n=1 Tax=Polistes dominula TaxID=743375 RepID=A0ABM1JBE1_POLDO|nr:PREDICTED: protein toll-like [Polistes dominula]